jgi:GTP-binding protein YchF
MLLRGFKPIRRSVRAIHTSWGLVGYPNVGKSTLFNALTQTQQAEASNYPFCTIDPNTAKVGIYDEYIERLTKVAKPEKVVPAQLEIWDIAGLIKGASEGAGLGNRFLANIRTVSVIIQVIRCFTNINISHVEGTSSFDPVSEMDAVKTELILADLETWDKRRKRRGLPKNETEIWEKVYAYLNEGNAARDIQLTKEEDDIVKQISLLTHKPIVYLCNTDAEAMGQGDNHLSNEFKAYIKENEPDNPVITLSAELEFEASVIKNDGNSDEEKRQLFNEYLDAYGQNGSRLSDLLSIWSDHLSLQKFYTAGPECVSSWLIHKGGTADEAAGKIHTDFQKNFIWAEISSVEDWEKYGGTEESVKKANKWKRHGRDYKMQEGDVVVFRHGSK